jgi:flagellar FliL protein
MAKETPSAPVAESAPRKNRTKLLLIIIIVMLLLVMLGAGAAFLLISGNHDDEAIDDEEDVVQDEGASKRKKTGVPPAFLNFDRITVNLRSEPGTGSVFIQVGITLELDDPAAEALIKSHMPRITNNVILILSEKTEEELLAREGKENLAREIRDAINMTVNPPAKGKKPAGPVLAVLFPFFLIQ